MKTEPPLINKCAPLDLELCELLGDKPSDFVVLQADGQTVPGYGTPYDSAANRQRYTELCGWLNDAGPESIWPKFSENWGDELAKICERDTRPVFSIAISRVCPGRSKYLHCAIRLFGELGERVDSWSVKVEGKLCIVRMMMAGVTHVGKGTSPAQTICEVVARALRDL